MYGGHENAVEVMMIRLDKHDFLEDSNICNYANKMRNETALAFFPAPPLLLLLLHSGTLENIGSQNEKPQTFPPPNKT